MIRWTCVGRTKHHIVVSLFVWLPQSRCPTMGCRIHVAPAFTNRTNYFLHVERIRNFFWQTFSQSLSERSRNSQQRKRFLMLMTVAWKGCIRIIYFWRFGNEIGLKSNKKFARNHFRWCSVDEWLFILPLGVKLIPSRSSSFMTHCLHHRLSLTSN